MRTACTVQSTLFFFFFFKLVTLASHCFRLNFVGAIAFKPCCDTAVAMRRGLPHALLQVCTRLVFHVYIVQTGSRVPVTLHPAASANARCDTEMPATSSHVSQIRHKTYSQPHGVPRRPQIYLWARAPESTEGSRTLHFLDTSCCQY